MDLLKSTEVFAKLAQQITQDPSTFIRSFLYDQNLFYDDGRSGPNQTFANNIWLPILEKAEVYSGYDVDLIIPAGTLQAKFQGTPSKLINFLNKNLAPKITSSLQSNKGNQVRGSEYRIQSYPSDIIIKYMVAK